MITKKEILMGRDAEYPLDDKLQANLSRLHDALNTFRAAYGKPMIVTSGYRPGSYNTRAGGATQSAHKLCQACDFWDPNGEIKNFAINNVPLLEAAGLYLEHPDFTPTWCHLQTRPTKNRIFRP